MGGGGKVIVFGTVECIGTKVFQTHTRMPAYGNLFIVVIALKEGLSVLVVGIETSSFVAQIAIAAGVGA